MFFCNNCSLKPSREPNSFTDFADASEFVWFDSDIGLRMVWPTRLCMSKVLYNPEFIFKCVCVLILLFKRVCVCGCVWFGLLVWWCKGVMLKVKGFTVSKYVPSDECFNNFDIKKVLNKLLNKCLDYLSKCEIYL